MKLLVPLQAFLLLVPKNSFYKNTLLINIVGELSKINYDTNYRTAKPYNSHR